MAKEKSKFNIKDQLAGIAALIAAIVAIGGGFVKYGEIQTKLDVLSEQTGPDLTPLAQQIGNNQKMISDNVGSISDNAKSAAVLSKEIELLIDTKNIFLKSLNESVQKIEEISRNRIKYCRVPYGSLMPWQGTWIKMSKYQHVFWSLDSKDYNLEPRENVISRVRNNIHSGDIVLFHVEPLGSG